MPPVAGGEKRKMPPAAGGMIPPDPCDGKKGAGGILPGCVDAVAMKA